MSENNDLLNEEINERITELFEKKPDQVSIKSLRDKLDISRDEWRYSYYQYDNGYWKTSVGTEIDLDADGRYNSLLQNELCTWVSACDFVGTIEFAWDVVEKLKEHRFYMEIDLTGKYFIMFGDNLDNSVIDDSAPLAICKAALQFMEDKRE